MSGQGITLPHLLTSDDGSLDDPLASALFPPSDVESRGTLMKNVILQTAQIAGAKSVPKRGFRPGK
jgi:hypothetical protein